VQQAALNLRVQQCFLQEILKGYHLIRIVCAAVASIWLITDAAAAPETVYFRSADGRTQLVGYLFRPPKTGPAPAIVMLHGRGGPYSSNVNADCTIVAAGTASPCNATTLSKRHAMWGEYWSAHGYFALLPDSFGPRGRMASAASPMTIPIAMTSTRRPCARSMPRGRSPICAAAAM
jgi:dienelactone hydrolase